MSAKYNKFDDGSLEVIFEERNVKSNTLKVQKHLELCNEIHKTYKSKNEKYGDSFNDTIKKYGMISALTRMSDKFSRIENNIINDIDDNEKLEDNLLDLANYCLMTVMSLDRDITGESIKGVWYNVDGQGD